MKKLLGKVVVGAIGLMMAFGLNAFAAGNSLTIDKAEPTGNAQKPGEVVVEGTFTGELTGAQVTILVAPYVGSERPSLANIKDENIKYIDQSGLTDGKFSYTFVLDPEVSAYAVWCGGTDITEVSNDKSISFNTTPSTDEFEIVGIVTLNVLDPGKNADITKVTATIEGKTPVSAVKTEDVNGKTAGKYTIKVAPGHYDVIVGREGYLFRTIGVDVTNANVTAPDTALVAGNVTDELTSKDIVDVDDLQALLDAYRTKSGDAKYNSAANFDDSDIVDVDDLQALLDSYRVTAEAAYVAE